MDGWMDGWMGGVLYYIWREGGSKRDETRRDDGGLG